MFRWSSLFAVLLVYCIPAAAEAFVPPVAAVRKLPAGLKTPAAVSEAVWKQPVSIPRFEYYWFDYLPSQQTQVRLAYDDRNLYVAFRCFEEQMGKLSTKQTVRDSSVWKDDSVSVMLDVARSRKDFVTLSANAAGTQTDQMGGDERSRAWNTEWTVETAREATAWKLLMAIPFKSLGLATPKPGTAWNANFGRISVPFHERSCWTPISRTTLSLDKWGLLIFGGSDTPVISLNPNVEDRVREIYPCGDRAAGTCAAPATPISCPGPQPFRVDVWNPGARPIKLKAELLIDDKVTGTRTVSFAPGSRVWTTGFAVSVEGEHQFKVTVRDASTNKVLMRTPHQLIYIRKHSARVDALKSLVASTSPLTAEARVERASVTKSLDGLSREISSAVGSKERWEALTWKIRAAERLVGRLRAACADSPGRGYALGVETSLKKVLRDEMFEGSFGSPLQISAARNEYESAQAVVVAHAADLKTVSVSVTPLAGPAGAGIPTDSVQLNLVDWVKTGRPRCAVDYIGWIPDPLVDLVPFDVSNGGLRPIWVTVHPPKDCPAGIYKGKLIVKPANAPESSLPIEVRVWDFTLPQRMAMKTAFALFDYEISAWYGDFTDEMRREWYTFLLEHRINPTNIYSKGPVPSPGFMPECVEHGLNAYTLACTWYKEGKGLEELLSMIRENESFLKEHGWWDMPYIYGFDELGFDKYGELRDTYGAIKKAFPDLPTMTTVVPNPDLKGYVDIWVPLTSNWNAQDAAAYTRDGDQVWWYVCCHPFHPYPNFFIDYPAIDPRILFWMNWKCKVPGVLYYAINIWEHNRVAEGDSVHLHEDPEALKAIAAGKRWPEVPWNTFSCATWNGDGQFLYPGPNGKPYSSIRLECIRDGIEDYEYFYQLSKLVERKAEDPKADKALIARARKLLAVRDDVVKSNHEYTLDPSLLLGARREVAEMIEALGR